MRQKYMLCDDSKNTEVSGTHSQVWSVFLLSEETYGTEMYIELMVNTLFKLCPSKQATLFHSQNRSYCW